MLVRGATRGNGVEGDEVTTNIRQIKSIPLSAKFSDYGLQQVEIRGEVLINKINFAKYNQQMIEQGFAPLANARNAASGTLRIKDPEEVRRRNLEVFVYNISFYTKTKKSSSKSDILQTSFRFPGNALEPWFSKPEKRNEDF